MQNKQPVYKLTKEVRNENISRRDKAEAKK